MKIMTARRKKASHGAEREIEMVNIDPDCG